MAFEISSAVAEVRVEHQVKLTDFTQWLERAGAKSPREMIQRQRLRSILGMPTHTSKQCTHRAKNKYEKQNELACCYGKRFKTSDYTFGVANLFKTLCSVQQDTVCHHVLLPCGALCRHTSCRVVLALPSAPLRCAPNQA